LKKKAQNKYPSVSVLNKQLVVDRITLSIAAK